MKLHPLDHYSTSESRLSKKFYYGMNLDDELQLHYVSHIRMVRNCLIFGKSNSGKSVFIQKNIQKLISATKKEHLQIILFIKNNNEYDYAKNHYNEYVTILKMNDPESSTEFINSILHDIDTRKSEIEEHGFKDISNYNKYLESHNESLLSDRVVFIDEFSFLNFNDRKVKRSLIKVLNTSWKVGIHFVIATKYIESFSMKMLESKCSKVCFMTDNEEEAIKFIGIADPSKGKKPGELWLYNPKIYEKIEHLYCEEPYTVERKYYALEN